MERISFKGVILGVAADIGGTIAASTILLLIFAGHLFNEQLSPEELDATLKPITQSGEFLLVSLIVGLSFSALGGYVAARVAKREIYLNAGLVGVVSVLIGLTMGAEAPPWYTIAGYVLVIPAALFGAHLADRHLMS